MDVYYGDCVTCHFVYAVADRLPNFCPECGKPLWYEEGIVQWRHEEKEKAKTRKLMYKVKKVSDEEVTTSEA